MHKYYKSELETKKLSQLGLLNYFEIPILLCNDIANEYNLEPLNFEFIGLDDDDSLEALEIFQYFLFDIDRLDDIQYLKEPLFYCNELNLGVLGFTNLGTHRSLIFTDIELKEDARGLLSPVIDRDLILTNNP